MVPDFDRSYSLLGHVVTLHGMETATALLERLDALLGPPVGEDASESRQEGQPGISNLTVRRKGSDWCLLDQGDATPDTSLRGEEEMVPYLEWLAYGEAVQHARVALVLHSGAVVRNGVAVMLPNSSGAGKTTLTLALAARGWLPLTDDVCPLEEHTGAFVATGCQRCCHVDSTSLAILQAHGIALEGPVAGLGDYYRPRQWGARAPVRGIVIPNYVADSPTHLEAITQAECLGQLITMLFEHRVYAGHEQRSTAARLAMGVPGFTLTYSSLDDALNVFETLETQLADTRSPQGGNATGEVVRDGSPASQ